MVHSYENTRVIVEAAIGLVFTPNKKLLEGGDLSMPWILFGNIMNIHL